MGTERGLRDGEGRERARDRKRADVLGTGRTRPAKNAVITHCEHALIKSNHAHAWEDGDVWYFVCALGFP